MAGGDAKGILTGLQFIVLVACITAAYSIWFKPSKRLQPLSTLSSAIGSVLHFAVKGAIAASLFEYYQNTMTDLMVRRHLAKYPDDVDYSQWQTAIWIILIGQLFIFHLAEAAMYGRESVALVLSGKFDFKRWYATSLYMLVMLSSLTLTIMFFMSGIYMAGSFHIYVAAMYGAWMIILNFCWDQEALDKAAVVVGANRGSVDAKKA